jgi:uncharacterized protein YyaL (SSP411 family)
MASNRLAREKSPYLLQHANNPVRWWPWTDEAFQEAEREDKPVFLSVGYSTCHWCHVMERESFESEAIAAILNEHFVSIKVDREERPDVDRIYMAYVQAATQSGGWPMSVWLTPDRKPFYGGTYFPPDSRYGRPGFADLLRFLAKAWREDREAIQRSGANAIEQLSRMALVVPEGSPLDDAAHARLYQILRNSYDARYGGFGHAPKFPRPAALNFLFRYGRAFQEPEAARMALHQLKAMAEGGINDLLGAGFHRYSVDERWFVPHFEKMLYDQAQLVSSYVDAFEVTGDRYFADVAIRTLDYVQRDLTHPNGPFYSAEDADSVIDPEHPHEKGEGAYYVWTHQELIDALGETLAKVVSDAYGGDPDGNVEHDPHQEFVGKNILFQAETLARVAVRAQREEAEVAADLARARALLLERRQGRIRPHLDDKILTSWNGLMAAAFTQAGRALGRPEYVDAALKAVRFVTTHLYPKQRLLRRYRDGEAAIDAFLDDYAALAAALVELYETTFDPAHLALAEQLTDQMVARFWDHEQGAFYTTAPAADLVLRVKDDYDGAEPAGNSMAAAVLLRLGHLLDRGDYLQAAERLFAAFASRLGSSQSATLPQMMAALLLAQRPVRQVVIAGALQDRATRALVDCMRGRFLPDTVTVVLDPGTRDWFDRRSPALAAMGPVGGVAAAYVCRNFTCQQPVTEPSELEALLD